MYLGIYSLYKYNLYSYETKTRYVNSLPVYRVMSYELWTLVAIIVTHTRNHLPILNYRNELTKGTWIPIPHTPTFRNVGRIYVQLEPVTRKLDP